MIFILNSIKICHRIPKNEEWEYEELQTDFEIYLNFLCVKTKLEKVYAAV